MTNPSTKPEPTPEQKTLRRAGRLIAFSTWRQGWQAANPEAGKDERKAAWAEVRKAETKKTLHALRRLQRAGLEITQKAPA